MQNRVTHVCTICMDRRPLARILALSIMAVNSRFPPYRCNFLVQTHDVSELYTDFVIRRVRWIYLLFDPEKQKGVSPVLSYLR